MFEEFEPVVTVLAAVAENTHVRRALYRTAVFTLANFIRFRDRVRRV